MVLRTLEQERRSAEAIEAPVGQLLFRFGVVSVVQGKSGSVRGGPDKCPHDVGKFISALLRTQQIQ
jgi:hypothetical protein